MDPVSALRISAEQARRLIQGVDVLLLQLQRPEASAPAEELPERSYPSHPHVPRQVNVLDALEKATAFIHHGCGFDFVDMNCVKGQA